MSIAGLLIALVLTLAALAIVVQPLFRSARGADMGANKLALQRDRLTVYYARVLTNIRDLDEDFATGKIGPEDYETERDVWAQRGIRLLRVQDQVDAERSLASAGSDAERIDRAIEEAVSAYRDGTRPDVDKLTSEKER